MWHRRIPHYSVGESFHLGEQETQFKERAGDELEGSLSIPVDELQALFRGVNEYDDLRSHPKFVEHEVALDSCEELAAMWNYTTREELGGRRPIELYLREIVRAGDVDPEDDYGTKHIQCEHTGELLTKPDFFGPTFFAFVEGRDLHGLDMAPPHTRFPAST